MAHFTGKSITPPTQADQERERIKAAAVARLQLAAILYDLTADTPEAARAPRTDAEILEAKYRAGNFPPGYKKADFARDQAATIDRLLDPLREAYGPGDADLQRATAYRNYLQAYRPGQDRNPENKGGRHKAYQGTLSALLIEDGATQEQAAAVIEELKGITQEKGAPELTDRLARLFQEGTLKRDRDGDSRLEAIDLYNAIIADGVQPGTSRQNICKQLAKKIKKI